MERREGFFARWTRIARQQLATRERQLDDPAQAIDLLMQQQMATIAESRSGLVTVASSEKRLQALVDEFETRRSEYERRARGALGEGNRDAAKTYLRRSIEAERLIADGRRHLTLVTAQRAELAELIEQMRAEYDRLRLRREAVNALSHGARATAAGNESLTAAGTAGANRERSLESARETLAQLQARAAALASLRQTGALDAVGAGEFDGNEPIGDAEIENRLNALNP
jgi:phage shock protein A